MKSEPFGSSYQSGDLIVQKSNLRVKNSLLLKKLANKHRDVPTGTWRRNDLVLTPLRPMDVKSTSSQRNLLAGLHLKGKCQNLLSVIYMAANLYVRMCYKVRSAKGPEVET